MAELREDQTSSFYAVKDLYVKLDGEKVNVESCSVHSPGQLVYGEGFMGDPNIPVLLRNNNKLDIYLSDKAKEDFSLFEFNGEKHSVKGLTVMDTRRGREILFLLKDGTEVRLVRWEKPAESFYERGWL